MKVSVIMPVYNGEAFFEPACRSVLAQTERNIELIVIDDGSSDQTPAIADRIARQDKRMRVFHRSNSGVSASRNFALEQVRGEWIYFCDADDIMHPHMFEVLLDAAQKYALDHVVCRFDTFSTKHTDCELPSEIAVETGQGASFYDRLVKSSAGTGPCFRIFKKHLLDVDSMRFDPTMTYGEDMFFVWKLTLLAGNSGFVNLPLYHYRMTPVSATSRWHADLYENYRRAFDDIMSFAAAHGCDDNNFKALHATYFADRLPALFRMEARAPYSKSEKLARVQMILADPLMTEGMRLKKMNIQSPEIYLANARKTELKEKIKRYIRLILTKIS